MAAPTEKIGEVTVVPLGYRGPYKSALILVDEGKTIDDTNIITLDNDADNNFVCTTIISVYGHVRSTGAAQVYSYATNVLTKVGGAATRDVIEILYE